MDLSLNYLTLRRLILACGHQTALGLERSERWRPASLQDHFWATGAQAEEAHFCQERQWTGLFWNRTQCLLTVGTHTQRAGNLRPGPRPSCRPGWQPGSPGQGVILTSGSCVCVPACTLPPAGPLPPPVSPGGCPSLSWVLQMSDQGSAPPSSL